MSETLRITAESRAERYSELYPQLVSLTYAEPNLVANVGNIMAALKEAFGFWWVGVYWVLPTQKADNHNENPEELVLGPFHGPVACTRIAKGRGVCGTAWAENRTIVVPDVEAFPGHIACSAATQSEIVVPIRTVDGVIGVLDVDSEHSAHFSEEVDKPALEAIANWIGYLHTMAKVGF